MARLAPCLSQMLDLNIILEGKAGKLELLNTQTHGHCIMLSSMAGQRDASLLHTPTTTFQQPVDIKTSRKTETICSALIL